MAAPVAAVIAMKERHLVEAFERANATTTSAAISENDLGIDVSHIAWRRLRSRAVVREASPGSGTYYLDQEVWQAVRRTRRRLAIVMITLALIAGIVLANHDAIFGATQR